jgi:hypothetical protein
MTLAKVLTVAVALAFAGTNQVLAASSGLPGVTPRGDGCCDTTPNYGNKIDINTTGHIPGDVIGASLQGAFGVVFPPATVPPAPAGPVTEATTDGARPAGCDLTFSGVPHFSGLEVMQFLAADGTRMAVSIVGLSEGFNDAIGSVELRAYDCEGVLVGSVTNSELDFEFLTIDANGRNIIHYITVGGADDPAGAAINCISFDEPLPCSPVPVESGTWGKVKTLYR